MLDKKGQMSEALTWVIATIIIIVILGISIAVLSLNSNSRKMRINIKSDVFAVKSVLGYLLTGNNYDDLKMGSLEGDKKVLVESIFSTIYGGDYFQVRLNLIGTPLYIYSSIREDFKLNDKKVLEIFL